MKITKIAAHRLRIPYDAGPASFKQGASAIAAIDMVLLELSTDFGPGLLATLHLLSLRDDGTYVEIFYMRRDACLWRGLVDVDGRGTVGVPDGPGLGADPDPAVIERYAIR